MATTTRKFQKGQVVLLMLEGGHTFVWGEITRVGKTGFKYQGGGFVHAESYGAVSEPPEGTIFLRDPGLIRDIVFRDQKRGRLRLVTPKK